MALKRFAFNLRFKEEVENTFSSQNSCCYTAFHDESDSSQCLRPKSNIERNIKRNIKSCRNICQSENEEKNPVIHRFIWSIYVNSFHFDEIKFIRVLLFIVWVTSIFFMFKTKNFTQIG